MESVGTWWMWVGFLIFVSAMLALDIYLLSKKKTQSMTIRESLLWMMIWASCTAVFGGLLWWYLIQTGDTALANKKTLEFFSGYLIEESLSVDNMFAFVMVFSFFAVPAELQRRVLLYGVLGAIFLRFIVILGGTWLVSELHWILYLFGAFLVFTGIKMLFANSEPENIAASGWFIKLRSYLRVTEKFHGDSFFIKQNKLIYATPLFLVLILIEFSDLIFALDSIPAIFAITNDVFIIFTSNIFAILGLRALYFLLANAADRFYLLKYGVAILLMFIGLKMLVVHWVDVSNVWALIMIIAILAASILLSIVIPDAKKIIR